MPFDFRQDYQDEMEARERMRGAVVVPISLLTALGSLVGYMFQKYPASSEGVTAWVFWAAVACAIVALVMGAYQVARAMLGHIYKGLAPANDIRQYIQALREWRSRNTDATGSLEGDIDEYLEDRYAHASTHN